MIFIFLAVVSLAAFAVLSGIPMYILAKKVGSNMPAWLAFIPILNLLILTDLADREWYWIVLMFIPFIGIFVFAFLWYELAEGLGYSGWLGVAVVLPYVGWIVPWYIALTLQESSRY